MKYILVLVGSLSYFSSALQRLDDRGLDRPQGDVRNLKRQQAPFSTDGIIPKAVATSYYTTQGTSTVFVGPNTAYFSIVTATGTVNGQATTATRRARMALHSGIPPGRSEMEYSVVLAPDLARELEDLVSEADGGALARREPVEMRPLSSLFATEAVAAFSTVLTVSGATGAITGLAPLAGLVATIGGTGVALVGLVGLITAQYAALWDFIQAEQQTTSIVVPLDRLRPVNTCPTTMPFCRSDECGGEDMLCKVGIANACMCRTGTETETEKCPLLADEWLDCAHPKCSGDIMQVCLKKPYTGCPCMIFGQEDVDPVLPNAGWLIDQQTLLQAAIKENAGTDSPSQEQSCGTSDSTGVATLRPVGQVIFNIAAVGTPKQLLDQIAEAICSNRCEGPSAIPTKSWRAARKDRDGCELSIAIQPNMEIFAYREQSTAASDQANDCRASFAKISQSCINFTPWATGWVNGPSDFEFFQLGYRALNHQSSRHTPFVNGDWLPQWCGAPKPRCDSCFGGVSGQCTQGVYAGCECEKFDVQQPPQPKVYNCATAVTASLIVCCGWSKETRPACRSRVASCGVEPDLDAICQSPLDPSGSGGTSVCGQTSADSGIVRGSNQESIAFCLNDVFDLKAEWKFA